MLAGFDCGCNCAACSAPPPVAPNFSEYRGFGGIFSKLLDAAGSFVGDPMLGEQIASKAGPGFVPVTQNTSEIAQTVAPDVIQALSSNAPTTATPIPAYYQNMALSAAPDIARELSAMGYVFPPGTVGAELQNPSIFDAFGGQNAGIVKIGAIGLAGFLALKLFKGAN